MENSGFLTRIGQFILSTIQFIKKEIIRFCSTFKQIKDDTENKTDSIETSTADAGEINKTNNVIFDEENISLIIIFEEIKIAMDLFFRNQFTEAKSILMFQKNSSMYHLLVYSIIMIFEVILNHDTEKINEIALQLQQCIKFGDMSKKKKQSSLKNKFISDDLTALNDFKIHVKLCSNEAFLLETLLKFIEQRVFSGVFKGTSNIANCYLGYRRCETILNKRNTWYTDECRLQFQNGVCFGLGVFHLLVTLLPPNVIKLLEIVGYGGSKEKGLEYLRTGCDLPGYHKSLCALVLLGYNLVSVFDLTHTFGDLKQCNEVLENLLELYPNSVWFSLMKAKYEMEIGDIDNALVWHFKAIDAQTAWLNFNSLCYWDMYFIYNLKLQWEEASKYAGYLIDQGNVWSATVNYYNKAICLYMVPIKEKDDIIYWMKKTSLNKENNSRPLMSIERFAIHRSERFFKQNNNLILPTIEMIYMKNYFKIFEKNNLIASNVLDLIENQLQNLEKGNGNSKKNDEFAADNKALVLLLKGSCLRYIGSYEDALKCLTDAVELKNYIQEDNFLIPYATAEIGFLYENLGNSLKAIEVLGSITKNYSKYLMENRLVHRIKYCLNELHSKPKTNNEKIK